MKKRLSSFTVLFLAVFALICGIATTQAAPNPMADQSATAAATMGPTPTAMALSGDPILIGVAVAQTGSQSALGQEQVVGAQVAEAFFNQRGGVNGRPIKLVMQDAGSTPDSATPAFNSLINANVVAIIGPTLSTQAQAADPVANKASVPVIAPSNTAAGIPQIGAYVTRVSAGVASYAFNAITVAKGMNPNLKNVAVEFAQDDVFSTSETQVFQAAVKKDPSLTLTTVQKHSTKDTDFTTQITAIQATNPDLIIISGLASDGPNLVKQLRDLGYKGLIIGGNGLNTANIFPVCQAACDGLIVAQAYGPALNSPINNAFVQAYQLAQGKPQPPQLTAQLFTSVQVVVEALRALDTKSKLSGMDIAALRTALNDQIQSSAYDTPLGKISFYKTTDKSGNVAGAELIQANFYVAQVKMNPDGQTGVFQYVQSFQAPPPAIPAATAAATMAATAAK